MKRDRQTSDMSAAQADVCTEDGEDAALLIAA